MKLTEYLVTTALCVLAGYLVLMYGIVQPLNNLLEHLSKMFANL